MVHKKFLKLILVNVYVERPNADTYYININKVCIYALVNEKTYFLYMG